MARVDIAFVGQCLVHGYPGVPSSATYPQIIKHHLERERPDLAVEATIEPFFHPAELPGALDRVFARASPDLVVVDVAGWIVANGPSAVDLSRLPRGLRSAYDRVRHFRSVSYGLVSRWPAGGRLVALVQTGGRALADGPLSGIVRRYPRPTLEEYEAMLERAIGRITADPARALVLQGPSSFNPAEADPGCVTDSLDLYRAVNALTRRLADTHGALFVDRMSLAGASDGRMFLPGSTRLSVKGHAVTGHAVADSLLRAGLI